jgi:hypothetical protein
MYQFFDHKCIAQFRSLGGTVGLAQCSAVMYAKVSSQLQALQTSGSLPASEAAALDQLVASGGLTSLSSLGDLPSTVVSAIRDAYRDGVKWSFISMIPWAVIAVFLSFGFSNIDDGSSSAGKNVEQQRLTQQSLDSIEMRAAEGAREGESHGHGQQQPV